MVDAVRRIMGLNTTFEIASCGDIALLPRQVLREGSLQGGSRECVFGDIAHRIPAEHREHIESMLPDADDSLTVRSDAYRDIEQYLAFHRREVYAADATSWCYFHEKQCKVYLNREEQAARVGCRDTPKTQ